MFASSSLASDQNSNAKDERDAAIEEWSQALGYQTYRRFILSAATSYPDYSFDADRARPSDLCEFATSMSNDKSTGREFRNYLDQCRSAFRLVLRRFCDQDCWDFELAKALSEQLESNVDTRLTPEVVLTQSWIAEATAQNRIMERFNKSDEVNRDFEALEKQYSRHEK